MTTALIVIAGVFSVASLLISGVARRQDTANRRRIARLTQQPAPPWSHATRSLWHWQADQPLAYTNDHTVACDVPRHTWECPVHGVVLAHADYGDRIGPPRCPMLVRDEAHIQLVDGTTEDRVGPIRRPCDEPLTHYVH